MVLIPFAALKDRRALPPDSRTTDFFSIYTWFRRVGVTVAGVALFANISLSHAHAAERGRQPTMPVVTAQMAQKAATPSPKRDTKKASTNNKVKPSITTTAQKPLSGASSKASGSQKSRSSTVGRAADASRKPQVTARPTGQQSAAVQKRAPAAMPTNSPVAVKPSAVPQKAAVASHKQAAARLTTSGGQKAEAARTARTASAVESVDEILVRNRTEAAARQRVYRVREEREDAPLFRTNQRLSVSGGVVTPPENRLTPGHTIFAGANPNTVARYEEGSSGEMSVRYKVRNGTAARLAVNPQDESSPLYTPGSKDSGISTGLYLDTDVLDNVQLQVGGEYRSAEERGQTETRAGGGTGASVGLRWNF